MRKLENKGRGEEKRREDDADDGGQ